MTEDVFVRHAKKISDESKDASYYEASRCKKSNEGATSDAETLHNMKRLFIRVTSGIEASRRHDSWKYQMVRICEKAVHT